jgi:uncharacterized phage-associated protein
MKPDVFDVSQYILEKLGTLSTMKLQKLVYYCQAWSLVWDDEPLFNEEIEAWANGPVVPALYQYHRGSFAISKIAHGNSSKLNPNQKDTIDNVLKTYSSRPAKWLIDLTHMEDPWLDAREGLDANERGNRTISHEAMFDYYSSLK